MAEPTVSLSSYIADASHPLALLVPPDCYPSVVVDSSDGAPGSLLVKGPGMAARSGLLQGT